MIVSALDMDQVLDMITSHLGNIIKHDSMSILLIEQRRITDYCMPGDLTNPNIS